MEINKLNIGQRYLIETKDNEYSGIFRGTTSVSKCFSCGKDKITYGFRVGKIINNLYRFEDIYLCEKCLKIKKELY